jgi:beta-carotene hydroxylase
MAKLLLPCMKDLGDDLTESSFGHRYVAIGIPFVCVAGFLGSALAGYWTLSVVSVMAYSFISYGSTSHDLVHGNLGFRPRENAFWLSLIELLGFRSGHAYRAAHLHHHARFPHHDDIEGEAAHLSFWRAVLAGPMHCFRISIWAIRNAQQFRKPIVLETTLCVLFLSVAVVACRWTWIPIIYVALVLAGSWVYPLVTAYFPHDPRGANILQQTRRFSGPVYRILFLDHLYHLEHHLYPRVPRHHWARLARRLDPWIKAQGVIAHRVGW